MKLESLTKDKHHSRWETAQNYEAGWWNGFSGALDWYRDFSRDVERSVTPFLPIGKETVILEIGSGAAGALTFLDSDFKYAVDPLERRFAARKDFALFRDPRVRYCEAKGEALPFRDGFFDLVIIDNVLDHCDDPRAVMDETSRVLKSGGIVFLRQNLYNPWGKFFRRCMELFNIDRGHPFTFTGDDMKKRYHELSWSLLREESVGFRESWFRDIRTGTLKGAVSACLFVTRIRTVHVLKKNP